MSTTPYISPEQMDFFWKSLTPKPGEIWKDVVTPSGVVRDYRVSNMGRVVSLPRMRESRHDGHYNFWNGKLLKPSPQRSGHMRVSIRQDKSSYSVHVHRLVIWAFVGPQGRGVHIVHKDGDLSNNRLDNLMYAVHWGNGASAGSEAGTAVFISRRLFHRLESALDNDRDPADVLAEIKDLVLKNRKRRQADD